MLHTTTEYPINPAIERMTIKSTWIFLRATTKTRADAKEMRSPPESQSTEEVTLNDAVLVETHRIAARIEKYRSQIKAYKAREAELEKLVFIHEKTIEKLVAQIQG